MKAKVLDETGERTIAIVLETGDEVIDTLTRFAASHDVVAARFTAIGAMSTATLGFFDLARQDYERIPVTEQVEVLTMVGDVTLKDGKPMVHAHIVLGRRDGSTCGGHLLSGRVRPTLEVMLVESAVHLARRYDERFGLALIDVGA